MVGEARTPIEWRTGATPALPAGGAAPETLVYPKVQVDRDPVGVTAGEVRPMIDVEHLKQAAHLPPRIRLMPDSLPQRQSGVHGYETFTRRASRSGFPCRCG